MSASPRFPRLVFTLAGIYGLLTVAPLYVLEARIGRDTPPPITHPEYFYGFIGVTIAWQLAFLLVGRQPERLRPLMPVAVLEKLGFGVPALVLHAGQRVPGSILGFGIADLVLGALFLASWVVTAPRPREAR